MFHKKFSSVDDLIQSAFSEDQIKISLYTGDITKAVYEYDKYFTAFQNDPDMQRFKARRKWCEEHLKRIYVALREKIGMRLPYLQIINRYKTRCMWYDRERLRSLVINDKGEYISNREHVLTADMARFLFDNGIAVLYRVKVGQHEIDLVDPSVKSPIFIEAKAYIDDEGTKQRLIKGIYQLHSYINSLASKYIISEAFYVIFRLGGPIYDFRERISFQNCLITPVLIDLGESKTSGSRQPKTMIITSKEIASAKDNLDC